MQSKYIYFTSELIVDGVDESNRCKISNSIDSFRRVGSGLLFPSLTFTIPVRTYYVSQCRTKLLFPI